MTPDILTTFLYFFLLIIIFLFIPFSVHLFMVRICGLFKESAHRQKGAIISGLLGFIPVGCLFYLWANLYGGHSRSGLIWPGLFLFSVYILFAYVYFHVFNMSETARRIRILIESSHSGTVTKTEIAHHYTSQQMIAIRLKRLISLGELRLRGNKYIIGRGILLFPAQIVFTLRKLLFPKK